MLTFDDVVELERYRLREPFGYPGIPLPCLAKKISSDGIIFGGLDRVGRCYMGSSILEVPIERAHDEHGVPVLYSVGVDPIDELGGYKAEGLVEVFLFVGKDPRDSKRSA